MRSKGRSSPPGIARPEGSSWSTKVKDSIHNNCNVFLDLVHSLLTVPQQTSCHVTHCTTHRHHIMLLTAVPLRHHAFNFCPCLQFSASQCRIRCIPRWWIRSWRCQWLRCGWRRGAGACVGGRGRDERVRMSQRDERVRMSQRVHVRRGLLVPRHRLELACLCSLHFLDHTVKHTAHLGVLCFWVRPVHRDRVRGQPIQKVDVHPHAVRLDTVGLGRCERPLDDWNWPIVDEVEFASAHGKSSSNR